MSVKHLYMIAVAAIVGCATGTSGTSGGPARSGNALTAEEIAAFNAEGKTAYDIVVRLRPKWLVARGVQSRVADTDSSEYALVIIDGRASGRLDALRDVPADQVDDIHYYDPAEVGGKFGPRGTSGVIQVRLKRASRQ